MHHFSRRTFVKATSSLLLGTAAGASVPLLISLPTAYAWTSAAKWMADIGDDTKLSAMSIPGTHESCARYRGDLVACQTMSVQDQLNAGIRFLDIRCRYISDTVFAIHHEAFYQRLMFGDVLNACAAFLQANSSECIVMSVKQEYSSVTDAQFANTLDSYVQRWGGANSWYLANAIPAMKDVRGKIALCGRNSYSNIGPINTSVWQDNATFEIKTLAATFEVQDWYKVPTVFSIDSKWNTIKDLLDRAKSDTSDTWYINFTSGSSLAVSPNTVADTINPDLSNYVGAYLDSYNSGSTSMNKIGALLMDFPDQELINRIISANRWQ